MYGDFAEQRLCSPDPVKQELLSHLCAVYKHAQGPSHFWGHGTTLAACVPELPVSNSSRLPVVLKEKQCLHPGMLRLCLPLGTCWV